MQGRKIYNQIKIDMETGEVLEEDFYWYSGPLALCDGEGGEGDDAGGDAGDVGAEGGDPGDFDEGGSDPGEYDEGDEGDEEGGEELTPEQMKEQISNLQAQLAEINATLETSGNQDSQQNQETNLQFEPPSLIDSDESLDDVLSSSEKFNNTITQGLQSLAEHIYKTIPQVVQQSVAQQQSMQEMARQFYTDNSDLAQYKSFVGKVSEKITSDHPDWGMDKVMEETAKEARRRLNLKQKTQNKKGFNDPGFPKKRSGKRLSKQASKPDPKQAEIDAMNKALGTM